MSEDEEEEDTSDDTTEGMITNINFLFYFLSGVFISYFMYN